MLHSDRWKKKERRFSLLSTCNQFLCYYCYNRECSRSLKTWLISSPQVKCFPRCKLRNENASNTVRSNWKTLMQHLLLISTPVLQKEISWRQRLELRNRKYRYNGCFMNWKIFCKWLTSAILPKKKNCDIWPTSFYLLKANIRHFFTADFSKISFVTLATELRCRQEKY